MAQLPAPFRALIGLVATVVTDVPGLSDKSVELSVQAVSSALQMSLRAQQHYAALTVRGDEVLAQWRGGPPEEPPGWARFDDEPHGSGAADAAADEDDGGAWARFEDEDDEPPAAPVETTAPATATPPVKAAAQKTPAKKAAAAKKAGPAKKASPAKKTTAAKKTAAARKATPATNKTVSAPRTGKPSAFDLASSPATGDVDGTDG